MYPLIRLFLKRAEARRLGPLDLFAAHRTAIRIWPWDLDPWGELNNGRTLTLFDLGRIPMTDRMGLEVVNRRNGWDLTVAGTNTRYRRRITLFQKVICVSRILGWDDRFAYVEQSLWQGQDCATQMVLRYAFVDGKGILPPARAIAALGRDPQSPPLPDWVAAWSAAESQRPWPPEP